MVHSEHTLIFMPHEIGILFGGHGFRPPQLPDEPLVAWDVVKEPIQRMQATQHRASAGAVRSINGSNCLPPEADEAILLTTYNSNELPKALAVLAWRALAHELEISRQYPGSHNIGPLALRQELVDELETVLANPSQPIREVRCPNYPDTQW